LRESVIAEVQAAIEALDAMPRPSRARATFATNRRISARQLEQLHLAQSAAGEPLSEAGPQLLWKSAKDPEPSGPTKALTLSEALNLALMDGMERDPRMIVLGEDVGREGGIFRVTAGLYERFGKARVLDTPLSEVCIAGSSVGMAIAGARCVPEIEFAGFSYSAFDQITFHIARYSWRTDGKINMPIVVRMPVGGGHGGLEGHSDSPEALYAHAPGGLVIVYPSNPFDAKGLLASALESDEPIVFFEPVAQYFERQEGVPVERYLLPIGTARFVTRGRHVTCVTYGNCVAVAREAAQRLQSEGIELELLDLRTLKPWDETAVLESVARTGRLLVLHEGPFSGGIGAEIVATVCEKAGDLLEVPPARIAHPDLMWAPGKLEFQSLQRAEPIVTVARQLMQG
jgi:pyruvate/2-oxoglutarate/acetoin dehydrogenase E1 component